MTIEELRFLLTECGNVTLGGDEALEDLQEMAEAIFGNVL